MRKAPPPPSMRGRGRPAGAGPADHLAFSFASALLMRGELHGELRLDGCDALATTVDERGEPTADERGGEPTADERRGELHGELRLDSCEVVALAADAARPFPVGAGGGGSVPILARTDWRG